MAASDEIYEIRVWPLLGSAACSIRHRFQPKPQRDGARRALIKRILSAQRALPSVNGTIAQDFISRKVAVDDRPVQAVFGWCLINRPIRIQGMEYSVFHGVPAMAYDSVVAMFGL